MKTLEDSIKDKEVEKERLLKEKAMVETELWKGEAEKERLKKEEVENQIESLQRQLSLQSLCELH